MTSSECLIDNESFEYASGKPCSINLAYGLTYSSCHIKKGTLICIGNSFLVWLYNSIKAVSVVDQIKFIHPIIQWVRWKSISTYQTIYGAL